MGYSNKSHIERILGQALTSGDPRNPNTQTQLIKVGRLGNTLDQNLIPSDIVDQYIAWADEEINSQLNEMYVTPFCELADFESCLIADIDEYNSFLIIEKTCPLVHGDNVVLIQSGVQERHIIDEVIDTINRNIFSTVDPIDFEFEAFDTRIIRVKYPEPITLTSSQLAASKIYDKYFSGQTDPNTSEYGESLRSQARKTINNILNGITELHGIERRGEIFFNPNIKRPYRFPGGSGQRTEIDDVRR